MFILQAASQVPCHCTEHISKTFFEIYPPALFSSGIVILLFIIERFISAGIRKREVRRNWYLKVIIESNLKTINDFFDKSSCLLEAGIIYLKTCKECTHDEYLVQCSEEIKKFQDIKQDFEFKFIELVRSYDPDIANKLSEKLRSVEDKFTLSIGANDLATIDTLIKKKEIHSIKTEFYSIMYIPIS